MKSPPQCAVWLIFVLHYPPTTLPPPPLKRILKQPKILASYSSAYRLQHLFFCSVFAPLIPCSPLHLFSSLCPSFPSIRYHTKEAFHLGQWIPRSASMPPVTGSARPLPYPTLPLSSSLSRSSPSIVFFVVLSSIVHFSKYSLFLYILCPCAHSSQCLPSCLHISLLSAFRTLFLATIVISYLIMYFIMFSPAFRS